MANVANSRRPTTIWNRVKSSPRLWDSSHTATDIALQAPCRNTWINGIYRSAVQALKLTGWDTHNPSARLGPLLGFWARIRMAWAEGHVHSLMLLVCASKVIHAKDLAPRDLPEFEFTFF